MNYIFHKSSLSELFIDTKNIAIAILAQKILPFEVNPYFNKNRPNHKNYDVMIAQSDRLDNS